MHIIVDTRVEDFKTLSKLVLFGYNAEIPSGKIRCLTLCFINAQFSVYKLNELSRVYDN